MSPPKVTNITYVLQAQEEWDKTEVMPDVEVDPKHKENIVGPMDIEPFNVNENEYTTDNPRQSSRKRDIKCDDSNQITHELSNKHNSRDSSLENDKKSQKGKQTWNNVKRMRKKFSKLNKKNRGKLNVSIGMVKKNQTVKPVNTTPLITSEQVNIDENTPNGIERQNDTIINESNSNPTSNNHNAYVCENLNQLSNDKSNLTQLPIVSNSGNISLSKLNNTHNATNNDNCIVSKKVYTKDLADVNTKNDYDINEKIKIPFIKKNDLCPKKVSVTSDNAPLNVPEQETISGASDDIEISIKIGTTITNILIKKKNDIQVKINTDCEVQTSLSPQNLDEKKFPSNHRDNKISPNTNSNRHEIEIQGAQPAVNINKSVKGHVDLIVDKYTSEKKNTASAETVTAQFEITASVEKELSNDMEYETIEGQKEIPKSMDQASKEQQDEMSQQEKENLENLDELHDLDIFSGSVKEPNVQILKENAPSEILVSTVCSKLKTQRVAEKRTREGTKEETLPKNKKAKANSPQMINDKTTLPDSQPITYDIIMGQVFANIDADMEQMKKSQALQSVNDLVKTKSVPFKSRDLSQAQKTQIMKQTNQSSEVNKYNLPENINDKHSENIFTILEKDDDHSEAAKNYKEPQVQELLTPVLCQNLDLSQESQVGLQMTHKSNKKFQDIDDSDRSVVEETPQKDISHPKGKRTSNNLSQVSFSETKKLPSKVSGQSIRGIIYLTDTEDESNDTSKDVFIVETVGKKLTLETPPTISKFAGHITCESTPVAGKLLNFDKDNEDNDPEQMLCPTSEVIARTTQEKEFMTKAFESTPPTSTIRPQVNTNMPKINKSYCLAASRLTPDEILTVKIVCTDRKWRYVNNYSKDITHLVVSVDEQNKSQRTVKYMYALADSKWIVSFAWIVQCLQNKDIVDEEKFEVTDSFGEPGPRRSRMAKQKLFQGIKFYCMPPFSQLDLDTLKNLLTAAGGHVLKRYRQVVVRGRRPQPALLLAESEKTQEDRFIYLATEHSIVPVSFEWVLNCLGSYTLLSIQDLLLCPSALLPEATAHWPEVLMAQDIDNE